MIRSNMPEVPNQEAKSMARKIFGILLVISLSGTPVNVAAQQAAPAQPQSAPQPAFFVEHAKDAGIQTCAAAYSQLGEMVTEGATYGVVSAWNKKAPDAHPIQGLVGLALDNAQYTGSGAGVVFAVPTSDGCAGSAVRIIPFPQNCAEVAKQLPLGSQLIKKLSGTALYEIGGRGGASHADVRSGQLHYNFSQPEWVT